MHEKLTAAKTDVISAKKEVQSLVAKNKEAIGTLRALFDEVKKQRQLRDAENVEVQKLKKERTDAERTVDAARAMLDALNESLSHLPDVESPSALELQIEKLEWIQQTDATVAEERALSKKIGDLRLKLPKAKARSETYVRRAALREAFFKANKLARALREKLREHAKKSDVHHTAMIKALTKAKGLREKLNEAFKDLDQKRALLASEQKEFLQIRDAITVEERAEETQIRSEQKAIHDRQMEKVSGQAKSAMDKLKSGKKISMDELLAIQQAGLVK